MKFLTAAILSISLNFAPYAAQTDYLFYPAEPSAFEYIQEVHDQVAQLYSYTQEQVEMIAKVMYHEARGIESDTEKACVAWVILNRVDAGFGTIEEVITSPNQFAWYENAPVDNDLRKLAEDVLRRWCREHNGELDVGRVLPSSYLYFYGDGQHNWFYEKFGEYYVWDYSLESPYED